MIAQKIVKTKEAIGLEIEGITLLSIKEYENHKDNIKPTLYAWWLRSPGDNHYYAANVIGDGYVNYYGYEVDLKYGVRPAAKINLESSNLRIGDEVEWANHTWTVISDDLMLCDETIAKLPFRRSWHADDANEYEKSDLKKWLENWLSNQMDRG